MFVFVRVYSVYVSFKVAEFILASVSLFEVVPIYKFSAVIYNRSLAVIYPLLSIVRIALPLF